MTGKKRSPYAPEKLALHPSQWEAFEKDGYDMNDFILTQPIPKQNYITGRNFGKVAYMESLSVMEQFRARMKAQAEAQAAALVPSIRKPGVKATLANLRAGASTNAMHVHYVAKHNAEKFERERNGNG